MRHGPSRRAFEASRHLRKTDPSSRARAPLGRKGGVSRWRAWVSWSSGKDSAWALHLVRQQGQLDVVGLLTTLNAAYGRVSMHGVREEILDAQAEAAGLPLVKVRLPSPCSNPVYEDAMRQAIDEAKHQHVAAIVFGDLFLEDVRAYRERQLAGTGIQPLFPLWGLPPRTLAETMLAAGLVAYVTCVDPTKLPADLAGRRWDRQLLDQLPAKVDPCGEQGEFHTCVTAGPMFSRPMAVEVGPTVLREGFVFADLCLSRRPPAPPHAILGLPGDAPSEPRQPCEPF